MISCAVDLEPSSVTTTSYLNEGGFDLEGLGKRGRAYIDRYYGVEAVAARLGRLYIDTAGFPEAVNSRLRSRIEQLDRRYRIVERDRLAQRARRIWVWGRELQSIVDACIWAWR